MDGIGNNRFASSSSFTPPSVGLTAPPPPSEVKVRTMRSDLAAMAKSGGGLPQFENMTVTGLSSQRKIEGDVPRAKGKAKAIMVLIAVAGVVIVGIAAYLLFRAPSAAPSPSGFPPSVEPSPSPAGSSAGAGSAGGSAPAPAPAAAPFIHQSFFKKPADQVLTLTLGSSGAAANATDLQTFNQKLALLLGNASKSAGVIEVQVKDAAGNELPVADILSRANTAVLPADLLSAHFMRDATFFVYQDKAGFWPGYVLGLNQGENWLFLKGDVQKLEYSSSLANFFLSDPGTPSSQAFADGTIGGATVRMLTFSNPTGQSTFTYGWSGNYLILSTSQGGFAQAVSRL